MEQEIEHYLHRHIPLSAAMGVRVRTATPQRVELDRAAGAQHQPSRDAVRGQRGGHRHAVGLDARESEAAACGVRARLVIQRNAMSYDEPIDGDFSALCELPEDDAWQRFLHYPRAPRPRAHHDARPADLSGPSRCLI